MKPNFIVFNSENNQGPIKININHITYIKKADGHQNDASMIVLANGKGVVVADTVEQIDIRLASFEKGDLKFDGLSKQKDDFDYEKLKQVL